MTETQHQSGRDRRLTLVIHSLDGGGAEKTLSMLANRWVERGNRITLITLDSIEKDRYPLHKEVQRISLDLMSVSTSKWQALRRNRMRIRELRRAILHAEGDYVISFTEKMNVLTLAACRNTKVRVIACERTDPRFHPIGHVWSLLRRRMYRRSYAIMVQTNPIREFIKRIAPNVPIYVVPNCIWETSFCDEITALSDRPANMVAMGRLATEKGFDLLIEAFGKITSKHPQWNLTILGDGPAKNDLHSQISSLGLSDRITLRGWTAEPMTELCKAQLFVMSSHYEGFPNALLEAMACGVVPISFDCESGPSEIIRHEVDGLLVPPQDVDSLAQGLDRLLSNQDERSRFSERALEVRERFSETKLFAEWENIFSLHDGAA